MTHPDQGVKPAMGETRIKGHCKCGERVTKILNAESGTKSVDGTRFIYALRPDNGWNMLRCDKCYEVIDENFVPEGA